MPDIPSPVPVPPSEPEVVPQVVARKHRLTVIVAIIVVVVIILITVASVLFVLWRSNQTVSPTPSPSNQAALPTNLNGQPNIPTASPGAVTIPDRSAILAANQHNLVITITYTSKPQFRLSVSNIERTYKVDANDLYGPIAGSPYSVLKIYSATNQVIVERPFAVSTGVIAEGEGATTGGQTTIDASQAVLNIQIPPEAIPQKIEIVSSTGQLLDTRTFSFDELPTRIELP
jgi:hypothetical protein